MKTSYLAVLALLLFMSCLTACSGSTYKTRWSEVETGHSRKDVIRIMGGEPNESDAVVLPMGIQGERLVWKGLFGERYKIDIALGRVVFKSTDE